MAGGQAPALRTHREPMQNWKIEVYYKPEVPDTVGQGILEDIADLGLRGVDSVRTATLFWLEGALDAQTIDRISTELLADPITQTYSASRISAELSESPRGTWTIEVQFKPGVTDAVGDSTVKGIEDLGITGVNAVRTGHKYWLTGTLNSELLDTIANRLLMNDVIQVYMTCKS